jgi:hypothetical protein
MSTDGYLKVAKLFETFYLIIYQNFYPMPDNDNKASLYESRLKDTTRLFIVILGISLFFFFLILIPYFSLRYDSKTISSGQAILTDTSKIISSIDKIINDSNAIQVEYNSVKQESKNTISRLSDYNNQISKIMFLKNNLSLDANSEPMKTILTTMEINPACTKKFFATAEWASCNINSKVSAETKNMAEFGNNSIYTMRIFANAIDDLSTDIVKKVDSVNSRIKSYKANLGNQEWFGSQIHVLDIASALSNTSQVIKNHSNYFTPLLGTFQDAYNATCPTITCRPTELVNPKSFTNVEQLSTLRNKLQEFKNNLEAKALQIDAQTGKFSSMFDEFQTPVGKVPVGFQELVAIFPFVISVLFLYLSYSFSILKNLKGEDSQHKTEDSFYPVLLFNPAKNIKKQLLQVALLIIPLLIFIGSFAITISIDFYYDDPSLDSDNPFRAAVGLNKLIYTILSILGCIFMITALWKLFHMKGPK